MRELIKYFVTPNWQSASSLGVLALVHLCLLAAIAITAALAAMPFRTVNLPDNLQQTVMSLMPEGWGFFTKSPRDPEMQVAVLHNGKLQKLNIVSSFNAQYAFGFNRQSRAQGLELDGLLSQLLTSSLWGHCQQAISVCIPSLQVQKRLVNTAKFPTLCGDLVFFENRPLPWAYRNIKTAINMPSRLTRAEVVCSQI